MKNLLMGMGEESDDEDELLKVFDVESEKFYSLILEFLMKFSTFLG